MLNALSIRNVVLIERLDLVFATGLAVLTGETGAGKSILLDALGLALGARADTGLIRHGAEQCSVTASFDGPPDPALAALLGEHGLDIEDQMVLRRVVTGDGRSRAFVNDQPVSVALLRQVGDALVEVHGQFDQRGLLDAGTHRAVLDAFGRLEPRLAAVRAAHAAWRKAQESRAAASREADQARREEEFLRHTLAELDTVAPVAGEAASLSETRSMLMHAEKLVQAMNAAFAELRDDDGAESRLHAAQRHLDGMVEVAGGRLDPAVAALDRAMVELQDALHELQSLADDVDLDGGRLEDAEERLFALRDIARKHQIEVDDLSDFRETVAARLALIDDQSAVLDRLQREEDEARDVYRSAAEALRAGRGEAARRLDAAVTDELPPLRLDRARFISRIEPLEEDAWGPNGADRVAFLVSTNPGAPAGPLGKIASGGELARFMLAIKVVLAEIGAVRTLVFDEVDAGVGGATADAVGERLQRLADKRQILVVTHSPQVAARGATHLRVEKRPAGEAVVTGVEMLADPDRHEEVARMLSGQTITDEARAAARRLIEGRPAPA